MAWIEISGRKTWLARTKLKECELGGGEIDLPGTRWKIDSEIVIKEKNNFHHI